MVRLGIIGLGFMGTTHAENASNFGHHVVAGADVDRAKRDRFGDRFDAETFAEFEVMYEKTDLDAVAVTVPNAFHEAATVMALNRDIDVLCEKPLAAALPGARAIAEAENDAMAFCMVGFSKRFHPAAAGVKRHQTEGWFGDITHIQGNYVRRRGIPNIGSWFTRQELAGGGALIDLGVHAIDFALFIMDYPTVEEVKAVTRSNFGTRDDYTGPDHWETDFGPEGFDVDDSASLFLHCADNQTATLEIAWACEQRPTKEFIVRGTEGGATCDLGGEDLSIYRTVPGSNDLEVYDDAAEGLQQTGWAGEMAYFLDAVEAGTAPEQNTVEQGLVVQRVIDAAYRSAESERAVTLD